MLVIRLSRVGKKKQPTYRVVVQEKRRDPWGTSVEIVGNYNPRTSPSTINLKEDRIKHWLERGAQPSATVHNLLVDAGISKGDKVRATTNDRKEAAPVEEEKPADKAKADEAPPSAEAADEENKPAEEKEPAAGSGQLEAAEEEKPAEEPKTEETPAEEPRAEEVKKEEPQAENTPAEEEKKEETAA